MVLIGAICASFDFGPIIKGCFVYNRHNYPDIAPITHCGEPIKRPKLLWHQQDKIEFESKATVSK